MRKHFLLLTLIFVISCRESGELKEITQDPFREAFWGTDIKMLITSYCDNDLATCDSATWNDTTWFDSKGNMVKERISGSILKRSFDNSRLLTRFSSDAGDYVYQYTSIGDSVLKQKTFEFFPRDSSTSLYSISLIKLNNNHGIIEEVDSLGRFFWKNFYDDQQRVIKKEDFDSRGALHRYWVYKYDGDKLSSVEYFEPPVKIVYQYRHGLLYSSTRSVDGEKHVLTKRYQLIFNNN